MYVTLQISLENSVGKIQPAPRGIPRYILHLRHTVKFIPPLKKKPFSLKPSTSYCCNFDKSARIYVTNYISVTTMVSQMQLRYKEFRFIHTELLSVFDDPRQTSVRISITNRFIAPNKLIHRINLSFSI